MWSGILTNACRALSARRMPILRSFTGDGVSNGKLSIVAGKNIQLNATVLPENATNKTVS